MVWELYLTLPWTTQSLLGPHRKHGYPATVGCILSFTSPHLRLSQVLNPICLTPISCSCWWCPSYLLAVFEVSHWWTPGVKDMCLTEWTQNKSPCEGLWGCFHGLWSLHHLRETNKGLLGYSYERLSLSKALNCITKFNLESHDNFPI